MYGRSRSVPGLFKGGMDEVSHFIILAQIFHSEYYLLIGNTFSSTLCVQIPMGNLRNFYARKSLS